MEYDDYGIYNGDVEHDMWVDYDHYVNTGEPECFDEDDTADYEADGSDSDFD